MLRKIHNMNSIKINVSNKPWIPSYKELDYEEENYIFIVESIRDLCEEKRDIYKKSCQYNIIVNKALLSYYKDSRYKNLSYGIYLRIVLDILERKCNINDWYCGYNAARRIVQTQAAWSTPGFYDAYKSHSDF